MKLGSEEIKYMNALDSIAKVTARDCIISEKEIIFVVNSNQLGKAIGKNGSTVKKIREKIGKKIDLFEYAENADEFLRKAFHNIEINEINSFEKNNKKVIEIKFDAENKRKALENFGRLKKIKEIMKRNHEVDEVRIV